MSGLAGESAALRAKVRIKYVDFQADPTHRIAAGIMPVVSSGHERTIRVEAWYQAVLCATVKR
jgi:hypothetical protein